MVCMNLIQFPLALTICPSDYNFEWDGHACVAVVPEAIPSGMCTSVDDVYMGSSGYRKIPGNTCVGGSKDAQVQKSCQPGTRSPTIL